MNSRTISSASLKSQRREAMLYARVSSKDQEKEGFSIPAQLKLLRNYAQANAMTVVREFTDVETAKQAGRTQFGEMIASSAGSSWSKRLTSSIATSATG